MSLNVLFWSFFPARGLAIGARDITFFFSFWVDFSASVSLPMFLPSSSKGGGNKVGFMRMIVLRPRDFRFYRSAWPEENDLGNPNSIWACKVCNYLLMGSNTWALIQFRRSVTFLFTFPIFIRPEKPKTNLFCFC